MKRFIDTEIMVRPWFRKLEPRLKLLWLWMITQCDMAGVLDMDWELASFVIGDKVEESDLEAMNGNAKVLRGNKIWLPKFVEFQYGVLGEESRVHKGVLKSLESHGIGYHKGMLTPKDKDKDKDKDKGKGKGEAASDTAGKLTPDNFPERAQAANGGRLTEQQLEAFCDYWTERNARGRCRFESEKFFELPKRIATWARRDRVAPAPAAAAKPERPVWKDCAARCRYWDSEKRWCQKYVRTEPKSCEQCKEF